MKCPKCGKEIANDSEFCELCGAQVVIKPPRVSSTLVAWIMFLLVICFSAAEMVCIEFLNHFQIENAVAVVDYTVVNTCLLIAFTNISVFVICIVLERKKQLRKSTSIALCLMSAFIAIGTIASAITAGVERTRTVERIIMDEDIIGFSILFAAIVVVVYVIYWTIAKVKHINF